MITLKEEKKGREPSKYAVKPALVTQSSAVSVRGASSASSPQSNEKKPQKEKKGREPSKYTVKPALVTQSSAVSVRGASSASSPQSNEKKPQKEQTNIQSKRPRSPKKKKPEEVWWKQDFKLI